MKSPLIRISSLIFDTPLAIQASKLETLLHALGPRLNADQAAIHTLIGAHILPDAKTIINAGWDDDEDDFPSHDANKKPYTQTDAGVAIIPIHGVLMKKGGWMSAMSGCASYEGIGKATTAAMDDPTIRAVLFDIDSPGGTTHGLFECCDLIYGYRGKKPTLSIANDLAASAAYAIASSADRILLTRTAGVGSIGVFCLHIDQSGADAQMGIKYTYIFAGDHKVDGNPHESLSKSAKSTVQAEVDRQYDLFVATVVRNRGVKASAVIGTQAEVLFSPSAIPLLADSVSTFDEAIAHLTSKVLGSSVTIPVSTSNKKATSLSGDKDMADTKKVDIEALRKQAADATQALADAEASAEVAEVDTEGAIVKSIADGVSALSAYKPSRRTNIAGGVTAAPTPNPVPAPAPSPAPNPVPAPTPSPKAEITMSTTPTPIPAPDAAAFTLDMATEIADLCAMVGRDELSATFIRAKTPVADVRKALIDARAADSASTQVSAHFGAVSTEGVDQVEKAAVALVAASGGKLTKSRAYEQVLSSRPDLYEQAAEEQAIAAKGTPGQRKAYIAAMRSKLPSMGLSAGA